MKSLNRHEILAELENGATLYTKNKGHYCWLQYPNGTKRRVQRSAVAPLIRFDWIGYVRLLPGGVYAFRTKSVQEKLKHVMGVINYLDGLRKVGQPCPDRLLQLLRDNIEMIKDKVLFSDLLRDDMLALLGE